MWLLPSLLTSLVVKYAVAQNAGTPGISAGSGSAYGSKLCNHSFADANATGFQTFNPGTYPGAPNVTWGTTVWQSPGGFTDSNNSSLTTELSLWFSTGGANYSNDFALGYDACYMWISEATTNTVERGQTDDGSCTTMLDAQCVSDLKVGANAFAEQLVGNPTPGPNSNLTTNSLPTVCADMASLLTQNFPKSCEVFFGSGRRVYGAAPSLGGALTGNQSLVDRTYCKANDSYSLMWVQYGGANPTNYYFANYWLTPLLTTFMPIANVDRPITLTYTNTFMHCLRATNVNPGSEPVAPAASPAPVDTSIPTSGTNSTSGGNSSMATSSPVNNTSHAISGGGIAGIAIGVVLGLVAIACAAAFVLMRRKRHGGKNRKSKHGPVAELDGQNIHYRELEYKGSVSEAPASHRSHELESPRRRAELGGGSSFPPVELPAQKYS